MQFPGFRDFVLNFLTKARPDLADRIADLDENADLFEAGVVDSHGFIGLCLAIEEITGRPVDIAEVDPEDFSTIAGLKTVAGLS